MVTPVEAVKDGFRKYAVFGGRANRAGYWWWWLLTLIGSLVLSVVDNNYGPGLLEPLFTLAVLLPTSAVTTCRLHDIGKTGW